MEIKNTKQLQVGDHMFFGAYPYDKDGTIHPIKWRVLDIQTGKALLLSEYGLDAQSYHNVDENVTWEHCSLRAWLNGVFFHTAFTKEEQAAIQLTDVDNSKFQGNPIWGTDGGNDTQDAIFLLSYKEVADYFVDAESRTCKATTYAKIKGAWVDKRELCYFWLRSPGSYQDIAAGVNRNGSYLDGNVRFRSGGVRPALWADLKYLHPDDLC